MREEDINSKYNITIVDTDVTFKCARETHLLEGMRSLGQKGIPSGCHGGGCGICKIKILSGRNSYITKTMSRTHISEEEEKKGIVLACRVFPKGDIQLNVVGKIKRKILSGQKIWNFS